MLQLASMKTQFFDGKEFARLKEKELKQIVLRLKKEKIAPKLISISVGENSQNYLYLVLKQKAAKRIGCRLNIINLKASMKTSEIVKEIGWYNIDKNVHGIMVQLPLPKKFLKNDRKVIINSIERQKDVDGLRNDSPYITPVVKAIVEVIKNASSYLPKNRETKVLLVGSRGFEGEKIFRTLDEMSYSIEGLDTGVKDLKARTLTADILISATGHGGLIKPNMIKEGVILIDIGSPKGDIVRDAYKKASFVSPVPGGVGPVTVSCLMENLIYATRSNIK